MKKRIIFALLCSALLSTAGCADQTSTSVNSDGPLTYWCKLETVHRTSVSTLSDIDYYKQIQEKTGVELEFIHPPAGQEQEQFNLMMSSRDYPDIIESDWTKISGGASKAISSKVIVPLNDIIDKSVPNYKKLLDENANLRKAFSTDSGDVFAFGTVVLEPKVVPGSFMVRRDWLEDLNMKSPETIEDWEVLFERMKKEKGAEAPFTTDKYRMETAMLFSNSYGIGPGFYVGENRIVKYGPAQPEFKEYLAKMCEWFDKGYLDNGIFANTSAISESKVLNGESGAFYGFIGSTMGRLLPSAKDENFDIIGVAAPTAGDGSKFFTGVVYTEGDKYGFLTMGNAAMTSKNKNPEKTAKLFNYIYSDEGNMLKNFGIEGKTYEMVDNIPTYTEIITHDADGLPIADAMGKYFRATYPNPGFANDINYYNQYYQYPQQKEALEIYKSEIDKATAFELPPISISEEEANELANIISTIDTYKSEMFTKFMMGTETLDKFDEYLSTLDKMGLPRVLEVYNEALKRYDGRN